MKRLQQMVETECGEEAISNTENGVLTALRALCAALERKRPDAFRHVARQATRAPSAMLRSDTALAELALALARRITRENITWSKVACQLFRKTIRKPKSHRIFNLVVDF